MLVKGVGRRTLKDVKEHKYPQQIFEMIHQPGWDYGITDLEFYRCRDRALMAALYCSVGRITAVVGGPKYSVKTGELIKAGWYTGLTLDKMEITEKFLTVKSMEVVKRSDKIKAQRGPQVAIRPLFRVPLKRDLYTNEYWDQLVPFGWLLVEYLQRFTPAGRIFPFYRGRAWQIVNAATGWFNHWFRAQAEHFYGTYLLKDSVKLSKFVKVKLKFTVPYVGYDPDAQLKGKERTMSFDWIDKEVTKIQNRIFH